MGNMKPFFLKRISVFLLCTLLLSSTVFMSYGNTLIVKAVDQSDLVTDAALVALSSIGLILTGPTLTGVITVLGPLMLAEGKDVYDYVTDNGDGTTTISEEFVQLVLQSYGQYKEENAEKFDGTMSPGADGYYHFDSLTVDSFSTPMSNSNFTALITDINTYYPCAVLVYSNRPCKVHGSIATICRAYYVFYIESDDKFYVRGTLTNSDVEDGEEQFLDDFGQIDISGLFLGQPHYTMKYSVSGKTESGNTYNIPGGMTGALPKTASLQVSSSSIPVYHNLSSLKEGLRTGDFSAAYNYGKVSGLESSKYTGSYSGGDIIVANEKLEGISDKLTEIDNTGKDIDDKLKDLLDWLGIGDENGDINGGSGGGSYDDTGLLNTLSGYFSSVLSYLEQILTAIEALVWIEADDSSLTTEQKDLFDIIDRIWEDPEAGSQEAADKLSGSFLDIVKGMTKKFPFSIPWDIHALFSVFARAGQSQPETVMLDDGYGIMPLVGEPDDGEYDIPSGDGTSIIVNWDENPHDAPYFVLPLVVESWGIEEYITVDLKDFQSVSTLFRSLLAVLFAVFLIKFTITLMEFFNGGD